MSEQDPSGNASPPASSSAQTHLLFVWSPAGYELAERDGEPPSVGDSIEHGEKQYRVSKVGASPLPGDERPCAFLQT